MAKEEIKLQIKNFDGPLDLLLSLVKDKHMDIFDIDLIELATSYLNLIDKLKDTNIDLASEYLVMAATLLQLKAKTLLQNPEQKEEIEIEKKDILKQLAEYQQFKMIAKKLKEQEQLRKNIFIKNPSSYNEYEKEIDKSVLTESSDAVKLIQTMRKMFERVNADILRKTTLETFNMSPAERRIELLALLDKNPRPSFEQVFSVPTINHFVLTLSTLLDMARKWEVTLDQDKQFDEIFIRKGDHNE